MRRYKQCENAINAIKRVGNLKVIFKTRKPTQKGNGGHESATSTHTVIRFVSFNVKFSTCTVVIVNC